MALDHQRFANVAAGLQSLTLSVGLLVGGIWTAGTFVKLAQAQKSIAEAQKTEIEAELARRNLANDVVVTTSISATQLTASTTGRWISVEVTAANSGTLPVKMETQKNMRLYVSRVDSVDEQGAVSYGSRIPLQFDYADKIIHWIMLRPGAAETMHAIQRVPSAGVYLARFAIEVPDSSIGEGREYSSDTFFVVK